MDVEDAIKVHASWRGRLVNYAKGSLLDRMNPEVAEKDDRCSLGRWLHGEGREVLGAHPHFDDLVTEHAVFHREAAALVRAIDAGEARSAMRQLEDAQSHFNQASSKVVSLLMALKSDVA